MHFTVITPSFDQLDYLKRCIASVQDQQTADGCKLTADSSFLVHHHIQDGGSTDGSREFLAELEANSGQLITNGYRFSYASEPDAGMYDAINRGIELALGERRTEDGRERHFLLHLNCDEQLLPDALSKVAAYAEGHPDIDVLFGDVLIVRPDGELVCCRKVVKPSVGFVQLHHTPTFTGATFFDRRVVVQHGLFFDTRWKAAGDADWLLRMLRSEIRCSCIREYTMAFTETGSNLSLNPVAVEERADLVRNAAVWQRSVSWGHQLLHHIKKLMAGSYTQPPFAYSIFMDGAETRSEFYVDQPRMRWASRKRRREICAS